MHNLSVTRTFDFPTEKVYGSSTRMQPFSPKRTARTDTPFVRGGLWFPEFAYIRVFWTLTSCQKLTTMAVRVPGRRSTTQIMDDEKKESATTLLKRELLTAVLYRRAGSMASWMTLDQEREQEVIDQALICLRLKRKSEMAIEGLNNLLMQRHQDNVQVTPFVLDLCEKILGEKAK